MVGEDGHAEVDQLGSAVARRPAEAVELGGGGVETDLESFDFAEPAVAASFAGAFAEVLSEGSRYSSWGRSALRRSKKMRQVRTRSSWKTARYAWVVVSVL
ncbi:hypothetical protein ACWDWU_38455 [Streptomyces sp. NPDC003442]